MGYIINEKKAIDENIFQFEERLKSPISRFLDTTPTFVTYYHINSNNSTVDSGFLNTEEIIGKRSPIKFQKIEKFPLYGIEQIVLQIQDTEHGLDSSYESDGILLPGTIIPTPNDYFVIPYLKDSYIFKITEIMYDSIMPDNFYKISFQLEYIDNDKEEELNDQVYENFTCILENIGSEDKCIIQSDYKEKLDKIDALYNDMASTYMSIFYNERHNCLLGEIGPNLFLYDPLQTEFINKHSLLNKKNNLKSIILSSQFEDNKRKLKYEKSVYRFMERRDYRLVDNFKFSYFNGFDNPETSFHRWNTKNVMISDVTLNPQSIEYEIFSNELVTSIKTNGYTDNKYTDLIQKFIRDKNISISDIPTDINEELLMLNGNIEVFLITPLLLYIIKTIVNDFMIKKI